MTTRSLFLIHIDLTELDREQTYNYTIAGIPRAVRYWTVHSRPDMADSDGDGLGDLHDPLPMTRSNVMEFVEKVGELEEVISHFPEYQVPLESEFGIRQAVVNCIRVTQRDKDGKNYTGNAWDVTSGLSVKYNRLNLRVNLANHDIISFFERDDVLVDYQGNLIDFTHMMATLSSHYFETPIAEFPLDLFQEMPLIQDLSGWAGDLQSYIYDLKLLAGDNPSASELETIAYNNLFLPTEYSIPKAGFPLDDLFSDIDAVLLHETGKPFIPLSEMLTVYYQSIFDKNRYDLFIEKQGGIENLIEKTADYVCLVNQYDPMYSNTDFKHKILRDHARAAKKDATEKNFSFLVTEYILDAESYALFSSFVNKLQDFADA